MEHPWNKLIPSGARVFFQDAILKYKVDEPHSKSPLWYLRWLPLCPDRVLDPNNCVDLGLAHDARGPGNIFRPT